MASLTNPNPIDNNSPNRGTDLDANFDICKSNDDALNAELGTKANSSTVDQRTTIQTGTGHAPAGTPVKMSWFEGTTNSGGVCSLSHGLGSNILGFTTWVQDSSNDWYQVFISANTDDVVTMYYDDTTIFIQLNESTNKFATRPARFLVWHK